MNKNDIKFHVDIGNIGEHLYYKKTIGDFYGGYCFSVSETGHL